jgi:superfamily II RNA helicase
LFCLSYFQPAIIFNFDRSDCDIIVQTLTEELVRAEKAWRDTNKEWKQKVADWEEWKRQSKIREQKARNAKRNPNDDKKPEVQTWHSSFRPSNPSTGFTFAGLGSSMNELEEAIETLSYTSVPEWQIKALRRGIAVHHAGTNKSYRTLVET